VFGGRLGQGRLCRAPRAPRVVIDERGGEVAVLIDYAQYVTLLRLVASRLAAGELPTYWRDAVDDCLAVGRGGAGRRDGVAVRVAEGRNGGRR
jgi:hypothetical protein